MDATEARKFSLEGEKINISVKRNSRTQSLFSQSRMRLIILATLSKSVCNTSGLTAKF